MLVFVLILAASSIGVYSQRCGAPYPEQCYPYTISRDPYESPPILPCERNYIQQTVMSTAIETPTYQYCPGTNNPIIITIDPYQSPPILPCDGYYVPQTAMPGAVIKETDMPVATKIETAMPVMPFITDLPNCPDICLNDILMSPLGCLDPILTIYSAKDVCPLPDLPVSPLLPASSPISALASSFSKLLPPVCDCDCYGGYSKRGPIPPPFI